MHGITESKGKEMNLRQYVDKVIAGGEGSGCHGPNCGRPAGHSGGHVSKEDIARDQGVREFQKVTNQMANEIRIAKEEGRKPNFDQFDEYQKSWNRAINGTPPEQPAKTGVAPTVQQGRQHFDKNGNPVHMVVPLKSDQRKEEALMRKAEGHVRNIADATKNIAGLEKKLQSIKDRKSPQAHGYKKVSSGNGEKQMLKTDKDGREHLLKIRDDESWEHQDYEKGGGYGNNGARGSDKASMLKHLSKVHSK